MHEEPAGPYAMALVLLAVPFAIGVFYGLMRLGIEFIGWTGGRLEAGRHKVKQRLAARRIDWAVRHEQELDEFEKQFNDGDVGLKEYGLLIRRHVREEGRPSKFSVGVMVALIVSAAVSATAVTSTYLVMHHSPYQTCVRNMMTDEPTDRADATAICSTYMGRVR